MKVVGAWMIALALMLSFIPDTSGRKNGIDACRATDYKRWEIYNGWPADKRSELKNANAMKMFSLMEGNVIDVEGTPLALDNVSSWWVFAVDSGGYSNPTFRLTTTRGTYESDDVLFAQGVQTMMVRPPVQVAATDPELQSRDEILLGYESQRVNGTWKVVAFVHFPEVPEGDLITWSIREVSP